MAKQLVYEANDIFLFHSAIVPTTRRSSSNARAKKKGASVSVAHEDDIMEGTSSSGIVETTDSKIVLCNV